jgi:hypothetical protein
MRTGNPRCLCTIDDELDIALVKKSGVRLILEGDRLDHKIMNILMVIEKDSTHAIEA